MSGIFGWIGLHGQPTDEAGLESMAAALSGWGPARLSLAVHGSAGLGCFATGDAMASHVKPGRRVNHRLLWSACHLHNRDELMAALALTGPDRQDLGDDELLACAWEKWGENCVDHLTGDWCFAVWDAARAQLLLCRDHHGNSGLFYYHGPGWLAFAFSLKALMALPAIPRQPDIVNVSRTLLAGWGPHPTDTPFTGVHRLPPAHRLQVNRDRLHTLRYWRLEDTPPLRLGSDGAYIEAFNDLFARTVRGHIGNRQHVGISLSGGMDSSAVAAEAAPALATSGRRLAAFCAVPIHAVEHLLPPGRVADESAVVFATAARLGNVDVHTITARDTSPLAGLRGFLDILGAPATGIGNAWWLLSLLNAARAQGVNRLLTGQNGNVTLSWRGTGALVELALGGRWLRAHRILRDARACHDFSLKRFLMTELLGPLLPESLVRRLWQARHGEPFGRSRLLKPGFLESHRLLERMHADGRSPYGARFLSSHGYQAYVLQPGRHTLGATWQQLGCAYGIEISDPTCDKRVLEFAWAIPPEQHAQGGGRSLVRRAMNGRLPEAVLHPTTRGAQGADLPLRLRDHREEARQALVEIEACAMARELLNLPHLQALVAELDGDINPASAARLQSMLLPGLQAGLFLASCDSGQVRTDGNQKMLL